jgi:hypothetical protein
MNTHTIFTEVNRQLIQPEGRGGCIFPPGIVTDDTTKFLLQHLVHCWSLASLHSFESEELLFPSVDHRCRFCLLRLTGPDWRAGGRLRVLRSPGRVHRRARRHFTLSSEDIALTNPKPARAGSSG